MKAIYASKLYKASSRKSKIQASIEDPINLELVTQIKSYLDEEYQDIVDRLQAKQKAQLVENMIEENSDNKPNSQPGSMDGRSSGPSRGFGGSPQGGHPSLSEKFDMLLSEDGDDDLDDSDVLQFDDSTESDLEDVEESTTIEGIDEITTSDKSNTSDLSSDVKSLLSSDESTSGINRVIAKKNELWIHYNDDINLNNVMAPVIEKLSSSHLDCLNFNRLARSENAIVFQLNSKCDSEVSDGV